MISTKSYWTNFYQKLGRLCKTRVFKTVTTVYLFSQVLIITALIVSANQYKDKIINIVDDVLAHEGQLILSATPDIGKILSQIIDPNIPKNILIFPLGNGKNNTSPSFRTDLQWANKLPNNSKGSTKITTKKPNHIKNSTNPTEVRYLIKELADQTRILLAYDMTHYNEIFSIIKSTWLLARLIFLVTAFGLVAYIVSIQLRQLDSITETIDAFEGGEYSSRVPKLKVATEVSKLALRLNEVLNHTEYLMKNTRQITNNIAHDLRKPLTRIRNRLELLLLESKDPNHIDELEKSINDADNLLQTFNALLSISQAETGAHRDSFEKISLSEICTDMVDLYSAVAEDKNIAISQDTDGQLAIKGSKQLITQLISNLIDNACKYIHEGGEIQVTGKMTGDRIKIAITDNGPGIPSGYHHKVLERFTRLDTARTAEGNGLGLSLAKAVMTLHSAKMEFKNNEPGLIVELTFLADTEQEPEIRRNTRQL